MSWRGNVGGSSGSDSEPVPPVWHHEQGLRTQTVRLHHSIVAFLTEQPCISSSLSPTPVITGGRSRRTEGTTWAHLAKFLLGVDIAGAAVTLAVLFVIFRTVLRGSHHPAWPHGYTRG
jgi:hypothetical protein